jgi:hypothetical protein
MPADIAKRHHDGDGGCRDNSVVIVLRMERQTPAPIARVSMNRRRLQRQLNNCRATMKRM